jgi:hypothetical protein
VKYVRIHKKVENICFKFDKYKKNWNKKTRCPHPFLDCFKHMKRLLKHHEFCMKFFGYNFGSMKIYYNN